MKFLRRLRDAGLRLSATAHVTDHAADCPHCDERTRWAVRILSGYVRCQLCGRNPLKSDDSAPVKQSDRTEVHSDPQVPA